jgi:hypothetical protein
VTSFGEPDNLSRQVKINIPMIRSVTIKGYRGLEHFEMDKLGRINLLVGKNNSGKSSVLEALYLLSSGVSPRALSSILRGRGELMDARGEEDERALVERELDVTHLFGGHRLDPDLPISIKAQDDSSSPPSMLSLRIAITEIKENKGREEIANLPQIGLSISNDSRHTNPIITYPISSRGGIILRDLDALRRLPGRGPIKIYVVQYVRSESLSPDDLVFKWDSVSLTSAQSDILESLRAVDDAVENIASYSRSRFFSTSRGGFKVKLRGQDDPVPIGSLGDGVWRMLAIAISLAVSQNGILLIDEIDTGLHYSVLEKLWHMVMKTAKDLNVQVFATTHSYDCITSLASICHADSEAKSEVTIQRIEAGKKKAVAYDEGDIVMAAERHIEMR